MTLNKLYKDLGKLILKGYGRKKAVINKQTFNHALEEDGCCMLDIETCHFQTINILADDGENLMYELDILFDEKNTVKNK